MVNTPKEGYNPLYAHEWNVPVTGFRRWSSDLEYEGELRTTTPVLNVKKDVSHAILPTYGSEGAIGLDLYAAEDVDLPAGWRNLVSAGVSIAIPDGFYGRIAPRSGLALKKGIDVMAGVIDPDYRGTIYVLLVNLSRDAFDVRQGDRIAQLILERAERVSVQEVPHLPVTDRENRGFGSTGR